MSVAQNQVKKRPFFNTMADFLGWMKDYLDKFIEFEERRYQIPVKVLPLWCPEPMDMNTFQQRFQALCMNLRALKNVELTINPTDEDDFFVLDFSKKDTEAETQETATFYVKIEKQRWTFFVIESGFEKKIRLRLAQVYGLEPVWIHPDTLKERITSLGRLSGFTAQFKPLTHSEIVQGKGSRTVKLWGIDAEEELQVAEDYFFVKPVSLRFTMGFENPRLVTHSISTLGFLSTTGGTEGAFDSFMTALLEVEKVWSDAIKALSTITLEFHTEMVNETEYFQKIENCKSLRLKFKVLDQNYIDEILETFLESKLFIGWKEFEDARCITARVVQRAMGVPFYLHILPHKNEIMIAPTFESTFGAIQEAYRTIVYRLNPKANLIE